MLTASPITNQPVGKTFTIAIGILGVGAVLQLVLIGWGIVKATSVPMATVASSKPVVVQKPATPAPAPPATLDVSENPVAVAPQSVPNTTPLPVPAATPPKPTPVTASATPAPVSRFDELVQQGKVLRERGDMAQAITKFREASTNDPKSPVPLAELATTYDKMGMADKAAEHWKKIYDMGESAGIYYQAAEARSRVAQANAVRSVEKTTPPAPEAPPDTATPLEGIVAGATLGVSQITTEEQHDDNSSKHFTLHIPIKKRPNARIDVKDLTLHILFYDIVDGQNVVQTSANVNFRWATPPADWADTDTEELAVEYQLPKVDAKAAKRETRKYFGYIVRIYYKGQLQASTAEPERLAQQYPPPPTLQKENEK
jgi:hypothetical protein